MSQDEDKSKLPGKLRSDYTISSTPAPLPDGSRGEAWQVVANKSDAGPGLFALTGTTVDCFRVDAIETVRKLPGGVLTPIDWGVVDWQGNEQRIALIFQKFPSTTVTLAQLLAQKRRYSESEILNQILPRMVALIKTCAEQGLFHGGIRPSNIYVGAGGELTLNECISSPASSLQPAWMQPIERGIAAPFGRGTGEVADEIYSLGTLLAWLALGQLPILEMSDLEMLLQKTDRGSFNAIVGRAQLGNGLGDLVRGMLEDDSEQRWSLDTIEHWIAGRRMASNQNRAHFKPSRGLIVNGIEYFDPRSLADAFAKHPGEAMKLMVNDELIKWVKRTLKDKTLTARIADAANMPLIRGRGSPESFLVARIIIALHPTGPIRYGGVSVLPGGIGTMLQKIFAIGESPQILAEVISCQLPKYWFNCQPILAGNNLAAMKALEQAKFALDRPGIGLGIERCLYDLAPAAPLIAHEMAGKMIFSVKNLIENLETLSERSDRPSVPLGRHVAAYLFARDAQNVRFFNRLINARDAATIGLGSLEGLAAVQIRYNMEKLPGLARWLGSLIDPCILRYHNRETREMLRGELQKAIMAGKLQPMFNLIENPLALHRDRDGFHLAMREYEYLEHEARTLHDQLRPGALLHSSTGKEAATVVAGLISAVSAAGILIMQLRGL